MRNHSATLRASSGQVASQVVCATFTSAEWNSLVAQPPNGPRGDGGGNDQGPEGSHLDPRRSRRSVAHSDGPNFERSERIGVHSHPDY